MKQSSIDLLTIHRQGVSAKKVASLVGKLISVKLASRLALVDRKSVV